MDPYGGIGEYTCFFQTDKTMQVKLLKQTKSMHGTPTDGKFLTIVYIDMQRDTSENGRPQSNDS